MGSTTTRAVINTDTSGILPLRCENKQYVCFWYFSFFNTKSLLTIRLRVLGQRQTITNTNTNRTPPLRRENQDESRLKRRRAHK